jgi:glycosyltransferase involved in cell wall biosynthesis
MMIAVAYLTLEAPRQGQASYTHVFEIVEGLRRKGLSVDIYLPRYTDAVMRPGLLRRVSEYAWLQVQLIASWRRYDIIYVRGHYMAFLVGLTARLTAKPIVHEVNGPYVDITVTYPWTRYFRLLLNWLQSTQYRSADGLVAVTPQLRQWLQNEGCRNAIEVIPNGANIDLFHPKRQRPAGLPERYAVFFGGFARWQGIPVMLDALALPEWPPDVSLVIVGDGQLRGMVEQAAATNGKLRYLGRLPYADVGGVVAGAIAGLVPKTRDDDTDNTGLFPIKLFEILGCGIPAIVSDYPGQAHLVRAENCGLVITPGAAKDLADAVAQVANNSAEAHAMGARGHRAIASDHSWDNRSQQTARFIERAIATRTRPAA